MKQLLSLPVILILLVNSHTQAQFLMNEKQIIKMAQEETPRLQQIKAEQERLNAEKFSVQSQFDPKISGGYNYFSSNESAIIQFAPVFKPQKLANLGVEQKTSLGTTVRAGAYSNQISTANGLINNATQVGVQFGLDIDIWKNFLGRLDRSQLNSVKAQKKASDFKSQIDQHSFVLDIRKIYWALIANELSLDLSKQLVKTASQQLNESQRKIREGLGDSGDVARNKAQLQSRETSVLFFSFQKEQYLAQLKSMIPALTGKTLTLNKREVIDMEKLAKQCMTEIISANQLNTSYSKFDDIIALLEDRQSHDLKIATASDSLDLKLLAGYQASGVDNSHQEAMDRLNTNFRNGYQVGVQLQLPIGGDTRRAREAQTAATRYKYQSQIRGLQLQMNAEYEKMKSALVLLVKATESQGDTVASLQTSLKRTKRKFKQARVSLNTFILEQDNLFNSELQLIDTKRRVLHLLLDYFKVFTEHPCQINTTQGVQS